MANKQRRESHYVTMARIAYDLAQGQVARYAHRHSPKTYTQPQLVACVVMMFYLGLSYRDMEEWLLASEAVCRVLELSQVPDHSTLQRAYQRLREGQVRRMNDQLLRQLGVEEEAIGVDSTGFAPTQASQHYLSQRGRRYRTYIKGFYAVGVQSQFILAWRYDRGPNSDMAFLNRLRRAAGRYGCHQGRHVAWVLLADRGFDGQQARPGDLIPPRRGQHAITRPDRRARADLTAQARLDGLLGQRWKCETVYSVIKRKSGDTIRSRAYWNQYREVGLKGLVYNIHRLPYPAPSNFATEHLQGTFLA